MNKKRVLALTGKYLESSVQQEPKATFRDDVTGVEGYTTIDNDTFIVVFKCSNEERDWYTNFNFFHEPNLFTTLFTKKVYPYGNPSDSKVRFHGKYAQGYMAVRGYVWSAYQKSGLKEVFVCGYSMGAGVAPICALDIQYNFKLAESEVGCGFSGPRCVNKAGQISYNNRVPLTYSLMYGRDFIAMIPPEWLGFYPVGEQHTFTDPDRKYFFPFSIKDHIEYNRVAQFASYLASQEGDTN